jgi:UDP-N-acetylglucosamine 2-epimerase (non-hydrolysing)
MIAFVVGTTAELIKISPVFHEITERGGHAELWYTGMHVRNLDTVLAQLNLPHPSVKFNPKRTEDLSRPKDVPSWALQIGSVSLHDRKMLKSRLLSDARPPLIIVHGDTFTTVFGAMLGKLLKVPVAHIEAGIRSGNLRAPLPEEGNRRLVSKLVDIHFAPSGDEVTNLAKSKGLVINTQANTVLDAMREVRNANNAQSLKLPNSFGLVTLHRYELVSRPDLHKEILSLLAEHSKNHALVLLTGASDSSRLEDLGVQTGDNFITLPKMPYAEFMPLLAKADYVVTDSGGLQAECAYLGKPCLIHRDIVEQSWGIGQNVVLSHFNLDVVREFLENPEAYATESNFEDIHPSATVVNTLVELGFIS